VPDQVELGNVEGVEDTHDVALDRVEPVVAGPRAAAVPSQIRSDHAVAAGHQ
jgi:hypothetical protein